MCTCNVTHTHTHTHAHIHTLSHTYSAHTHMVTYTNTHTSHTRSKTKVYKRTQTAHLYSVCIYPHTMCTNASHVITPLWKAKSTTQQKVGMVYDRHTFQWWTYVGVGEGRRRGKWWGRGGEGHHLGILSSEQLQESHLVHFCLHLSSA